MKIVVNSIEFPYNIGCRVLKTKYGNTPFEGLEDIWDDIQPLTFAEITKELKNIEQRRVAITALGLENLIKEINPTLINKESISKTTTWVNSNGELVTHNFVDTYELYQVLGTTLFGRLNGTWMTRNYYYFVKFKDTSTDREYMIWVDKDSIRHTNSIPWSNGVNINSIQAIAWTFQTDVPEGGIEKIIRQGDCILIKKKNNAKPKLGFVRHLTEKEYRELLVVES